MIQQPLLRTVAAFVGIAAVIALFAYTYGTLKEVQPNYRAPMTISVTGKGEVLAKPDIATFSFSVTAKEKEAAAAQNKSAESINAIVAYLKEKGIEERDIKTQNYSLNPVYEYSRTVCTIEYCPPSGEAKLTGYEVSQMIQVKVRKTDTAGDIISGVGQFGATNISGLDFTIDDVDTLRAQARDAAIADAKVQADKLARDLGVRVIRMSGYWENNNGGYPIPYGMGGAMEKAVSYDQAMNVAPAVPAGENTILSQVSITYEVR